jgi:hypothetical protein
MSKSLQRRADAVLVLVFRRKVCHRDLHQVPILRKETKIRLLMADKTKLVPAHVNGALLQGNLSEERVTEHNHHGVVGRRSQLDGGPRCAVQGQA